MAASYCKTIILGNLTRDPELRYSAGGKAVASFSVAVNRKYKSGTEQKEEVTYLDITAFDKQAETLGQYLRRGSPIFLTCRPRNESWEDKQSGQKRTKLSFVVEEFQFLGGKSDSSGAAPQQQPRQTRPAAPQAEQPPADDGDSSVPF